MTSPNVALISTTLHIPDMDGEITPAEVKDLLSEGVDVRVVDIRTTTAFVRGHIPGSENIPFQRLPQQVETLDGASRVVTVCPHGQASVQAAKLVSSYDGLADDAVVESMAGGITSWEYDLEAGSPADEGLDRPDSPF